MLQRLLDSLRFALPAQAHEKWFVDPGAQYYPIPDFYLTWNSVTIAAAVAVAALAVIGYFADRATERSAMYERSESLIKRLRSHAVNVLAVATGLSLVLSASRGNVLADNFAAPPSAFGMAILAVELAVGALLLVGLFSRTAAAGLLAVYAASFAIAGPLEPFDYLHYVGIAVFLFYFARGRYSADHALGIEHQSSDAARKRAFVALRALTGISFIIVAQVKWMRPDLHFALLDRYAAYNPFALFDSLGIHGLTREVYVFMLFVVEFLVGLFLTFGFLTRLSSLLVIPLFVMSVFLFGPGELIGHLPILGSLFVFFTFGDTYHKTGFGGKKSLPQASA